MKGSSIINHSCDVLVAGGGVSGVAAAVAAARGGATTVLVEKENYLGGTGYAGLFQYICGLYLNGDAEPIETLNGGIAREIAAKLNKLSPKRTIKKIGQVFVLPYLKEDLLTVFTSLCDKEPNLAVLYNKIALAVKKKNKTIVEVALKTDTDKIISHDKSPHPPFTKGGMGGIAMHITPKIVIDCTGDGDVSAIAGADFELSPLLKRQFAGFTIRVKGLKDSDEKLPVKVPYYLLQAVKQKLLPVYFKFTVFSQGESPDEGFLKINIGADNSRSRQLILQKSAIALCYLAEKLRSFEDAHIAEASLKVLNREGRRISCEYILTEDDILNARKFDDAVVKNSWPIELWENNKGTVYKYIKQGDYYEIPFRCLKVKSFANLLVAGRCISVTREALGSTRVMGTCMSLGEQAGKAAAYFVKNGRYPY